MPPSSQTADMAVAGGAPGESSNESAGEALDVEGFSGTTNTTFGASSLGAGLGLGATTSGAQQPLAGAGVTGVTAPGGAATTRASRGIGIGLGVAAGAATVHRGMKRELSDSNIAGAGRGAGSGPGWGGVGGDMSRRSMSEQQKLERRVSVCVFFLLFLLLIFLVPTLVSIF